MAKRLSTIAYSPMVESVNRKFALRSEKCINRTLKNKVIPGTTYMGGSSRTVNITGVGRVQKNVMFFRKPINAYMPSQTQLANRANFVRVRAAAYAIAHDLGQITSIQQLFVESSANSSKVIAGVSNVGYESLNGWIFGVTYARLQRNPEITEEALRQFPTSFDA